MVDDWPGTISDCIDAAVAGFVATPILRDPEHLEQCVQELRSALNNGRLSKLTLVFGREYVLDLRKADRWKFWRRKSELHGADL